MKKLLLLSFVLCTVMVQAQTTSLENIGKISYLPTEVIKEGNEIKGYYVFYISDKIDKKTNEYTLRIYDNNLKTLKDIKFQDSKYISILETSFNGTDLIFLFYNSDENSFEYQIYGADGNKKSFTYRRDLSKKEKDFLKISYFRDDEENPYKGLFPIAGKGFISNTPSRENKDYTFQLDFFSTEKRKQWSYIPTEGAKMTSGLFLGCINNVVYLQVMKYSSLLDKKPDIYLTGLNLETGKLLFENKTDGKFRFLPASLSQTNSGQPFVYGEYFDPTANIIKDKSLGFAFWSIDEKGKILNEKYISWGNEVSKFVNVSSKGKIDEIGYMYLHRLVQTANGDIYAIGEGFKKVASAVGIAGKILTGGSGFSAVKIQITDMVMIKFDKDFNVKEVKFYEKNNNNFELGDNQEFVSAAWLAKQIEFMGGFDYAYTLKSNDGSSFSVCYYDYVRGKDYKGITFNSINYNEGKITTDKINTKSDATRSWILPAKQGQVLVIDYYKKAKKLEMHFEKLN